MTVMIMAYETHDFYCLNCGHKGLPIHRNKGHLHGAMHRKKLYCMNCKCEVNHVEIRNLDELEKFKDEFERGVYKDEAEESILACRDSWMR